MNLSWPEDLPERLRRAIAGPLPGHDDFREVSGYQRPDIGRILQQDPPPKESAVLALLYPEGGTWHTLLMLRPTYTGVHSGQVGFPGGHREPHDPDLRATAMREFAEETGADTSDFHVLGEMSRVYIPPSRALVTPVLAVAPRLGEVRPDPNEVAALLPVPLDDLMRDDILKKRILHVQAVQRELEVAYWDLAGQVVWGATGLMIAELRQLLARSRA
ncbi:MAG: CoA pyrophosphatase [Flavobacteriales bacterium]|nr:CoA pyrophosphatase [Flavobacteriales bacterium]